MKTADQRVMQRDNMIHLHTCRAGEIVGFNSLKLAEKRGLSDAFATLRDIPAVFLRVFSFPLFLPLQMSLSIILLPLLSAGICTACALQILLSRALLYGSSRLSIVLIPLGRYLVVTYCAGPVGHKSGCDMTMRAGFCSEIKRQAFGLRIFS